MVWRRLLSCLILMSLVVACSGADDGGGTDAGAAGEKARAEDGGSLDAVTELPALHTEPDPDDGGRIVDAAGREVLLRGVNVNALAEYWSGNRFEETFPLTDADIETIAGIGWNTVRLLVSWSRIEPEPDTYDEDYLAQVDDTIDRLAGRGIYTIIDLHQDAWGPSLAARPDEGCADGRQPALGWDGAPAWATLGGEELGTRCVTGGVRETSPAVVASFEAFFADRFGPGGVGIRTRYVDMLAHLAERWADRPEVAGYDVMNEPNAFSDAAQAGLGELYGAAVTAIRDAEQRLDGGFSHLVLFEPPAIWSSVGEGPPPDFDHGDDVVYAPHIYTGGFDGGPITEDAFATATDEAAGFGGVPVLSGEWGSDPSRAGDDGDGYFVDHQRLQDRFGLSATLWTWRESCGDPHKVGEADPVPWGEFSVDCDTNEVTGRRSELIDELSRGYVRAAPGRLEESRWDEATGVLSGSGSGAEVGATLVAVVPEAAVTDDLATEGLSDARVVGDADQGRYLVAATDATEWSFDFGAPGG